MPGSTVEAAPNAPVEEAPLLPDLPIVDAHVHLWKVDNYYAPDYLADIKRSGHRIEASIYLECSMSYSEDPRVEFRPVGEMAFVVGQAKQAEGSGHNLAAGIVGGADLMIGARVRPVLEALAAAADGRLRGVRYRIAYDPDPVAGYAPQTGGYSYPTGDMLEDDGFLAGVRCVGDMGLHFETWGFHPQLEGLARFAAKVPDLNIIINHCGGPLGVGRYAGRRQEVFEDWLRGVRAVARLPNVFVKVSGLAIGRFGFGFAERGPASSSDELAGLWKPYVQALIDEFSPARTIFSPGFPADRPAGSLGVVINAYKKMVGELSEAEVQAFFAGNARRLYRLERGSAGG